jgi:hypothetical protein
MITLTTELDQIDTIDWDAPTMSPTEQRYYDNKDLTFAD